MRIAVERSIATALITFFGFGLLAFAALMALPHSEHQAGCEVSFGETSVCLMSTTGIGTLSAKLSQAQPTGLDVLLLLAVPLATAFFFSYTPKRKRRTFSSTVLDLPIPLYTYLYSQGILNPKAP